MANKLLSLSVLMSVTSKIAGDPSAVTDWWEAACHNRGIVPSAGEQIQDSHTHGE